MSIIYPENRQEVINRILNDIQNELPNINSFLPESITRALGVANGGRFFDVYTQQQQAQNELFINTATQEIFIERLGLLKGITRNPATAAIGFVTITGSSGGTVSVGDLYETESEQEYEVITGGTITAQTLNVSNITRSGSTATVTTVTSHSLAPNIDVAIAGANEAEYNGTFTIISVPSANTFTYAVTGTPATPATGTITVSASYAKVEVEATQAGLDTNIDVGGKLTLKASIANVDDDAYVQFGNISGGADEETIDEYKSRVQDAYANPVAHFNEQDIINLAKTIAGVTRVWVFPITPEPGEVTIYFVRDNDPNIIPDSNEISQVRDLILTIKPADMEDSYVNVNAPTALPVSFVFTSLSPDSQAMRTAVEDNLKQFFKDQTNVSENVTEDEYRSAIQQTINPETGEQLKSFSLSSPAGDISVSDGYLATYDSVTWSI